jgi:hypothetical protein
MINLEKHPTRVRTYIAYDAQGRAFRITPSGVRWEARPSYSGADRQQDPRYFFAGSLREIAAHVGASSRGF